MKMFKDKNGNMSSKRIIGTIVVCFSMCLTIYVIMSNYNYNILMYPYSLSGALLGLGVFENKK